MVENTAVACFVRNRGSILVVRRTHSGGPEPWTVVQERVDDRPDEAARRAVSNLGNADHVTLVRSGEPLSPDESDTGRILPYLFDCGRRESLTNDLDEEYAWISPPEILRRDAVPWLWEAYSRVAPTVETVETDYMYGSAYLSLRALEVLRDEAARVATTGGDWSELADLARTLIASRRTMAVVENRINRAMAQGADERSARAVERGARETLAQALDADELAGEKASDLVDDAVVFTHSRSGTVLGALERADPSHVFFTESRTDDEGAGAAEAVAEYATTTITTDAAITHFLSERNFDVVLVGADSILPDGTLVNKVGTRTAALAADRRQIPFYVVAASDKIRIRDGEWQKEREDAEVYDGDRDVDVENPVFDATPPELVSGVVTERGVLSTDDVRSIASELEEAAEWHE